MEHEGGTAIGYLSVVRYGWGIYGRERERERERARERIGSVNGRSKREGFCNCKLLLQLDMHIVQTRDKRSFETSNN